jgi:hypothetical protein
MPREYVGHAKGKCLALAALAGEPPSNSLHMPPIRLPAHLFVGGRIEGSLGETSQTPGSNLTGARRQPATLYLASAEIRNFLSSKRLWQVLGLEQCRTHCG